MIIIDATIDDRAWKATASELLRLAGPLMRRDMNEAAAIGIQELLQEHISDYAQNHHRSADTIGQDKRYHSSGTAKRTGHLEKAAAEGVQMGDISADGAEVHIKSPGFRRALGPVTIVPKTKPALTVAVDAISYGNTYADLIASGLIIFRPKGRDFLATTIQEGGKAKMIILYILKQQVTLSHEPELLPAESDIRDTAHDEVKALILHKLEKLVAA